MLLRHPWARQVVEARRRRSKSVLAYMDSLAGTFITAGFPADLTHHVMHALGHRMWGFSPEAFDEPGSGPSPVDSAEQKRVLRQMADAYPHIVAVALDASGGDLPAIGQSCDE